MATTAPRPLRKIVVLLVLIAAMFGSVAIAQQLDDDTDDEVGPSFAPGLALDLEGGVQLILTPRLDPEAEGGDAEITDEDIDQAIEIIRQRVDASGVSEAEITRQGGANIVVGLPGDPDEATLDLVRQSAQLRFRPVLSMANPTPIDPNQEDLPTAPESDAEAEAPEEGAEQPPEDPADALEEPVEPGEEPAQEDSEQAADPDREAIEEAAFQVADEDGDGELSTTPAAEPTSNSDVNWITERIVYDLYTLDCTDPANLVGGIEDDAETPLVACSQDGTGKFILGPVDVEGTNVGSATSGLEVTQGGVTTNNWVVNIEFDSTGTELFREVSERLVAQSPPQNQFGIVLDGLVVSAPTMNDVIPNGQAQISGSFTRESANTLANQLNFGSLPLNFEVQSEEQISATLGSEHLRTGLIAGVGGLFLVALYLLWQYRGLAVVAVTSLLMAALTTYGAIIVLSWLQGYRLSLAGVAGLIVAVGITADSFILYFERIRDEIREGRTLEGAVEHGWARAKRTIVISDLVTLLAAGVLYFLAVGGVRGFAFTLGLTTVIDLIVVFLYTHPVMQRLIRTRFFGQGHRLSGLNPEALSARSTGYWQGGRTERQTRPRPEDRRRPEDKDKDKEKGKGKDKGRTTGPTRTGPTIAERKAAERRAQQEAETRAEQGAGTTITEEDGR